MERIYIEAALPIATKRHCSNDCPHAQERRSSTDAVDWTCSLFDKPLRWDPKRRRHGNLRLAECKNAEATEKK